MDEGTIFKAYAKHPPNKGHAHRGNPFIATNVFAQYITCLDKDKLRCSIRFDTWIIRDLGAKSGL